MACHNTLVPRWTFLGEILGGNKPVQLGKVSWRKPAIFRLCSWCDFCIWNKKHFSCRCVECFFWCVLKFEQGVCVCENVSVLFSDSYQHSKRHLIPKSGGPHFHVRKWCSQRMVPQDSLVFSNCPLDDIWEHITKCLFFWVTPVLLETPVLYHRFSGVRPEFQLT